MATSDERNQATPRPVCPGGDAVTMLRLALDDLPARQQEAIRLATVERLTLAEIAVRLEASAAEVRDAIREGLFALRDVLDVIDSAAGAEPEHLDA